MKKWKYEIYNPDDASTTEVFPRNAGAEEYSFEKKNPSDVFLTKTLTSQMIFLSNGEFNFKTQEANNPATELIITIYQRCNGDWQVFFVGVFAVCEGQFDDFKCNFSINPRLNQSDLQSDVELNMLSGDILIKENGANIGVFTGTGGAARNYLNAFTLESVLLSLAKRLNHNVTQVVSDFFQINPITVSANCLPGVPNMFTDLVVCALSDIQEPVPSNLSTYNPIKFSDFMGDLNVLFDVYWFISGNILRIEHRIYFDGVTWLNLNDARFSKFIPSRPNYSYDLESYPRSEVWKIIDSDSYAKKRYNQISTLVKNQNEVTRETKLIRTDYVDIRYHGNNHSEYGVFLFATQLSGGKYIMREVDGQNFYLTPSWVAEHIHTYGRPYLYALFDGLNFNSSTEYIYSGGHQNKSIGKSKIVKSISVPLCCDDLIDPNGQINTPFGTAYLKSGKFSARDSIMQLDLKLENIADKGITPSDISDLGLWLKSGTGITHVAGAVSQWDDQSGNGRHAVQATGGLKPNYPGGDSIDFTGTKFLHTPAFTLFPGKRGTVFILWTRSTNSSVDQFTLLSNYDGSASNFWDYTFLSETTMSNQGEQLFTSTLFGYPHLNFTSSTGVLGTRHDGLYIMTRYTNVFEKYKNNALIPFENTNSNPQSISNRQVSNLPLIIGWNAALATATGLSSSGTFRIKEVIIYERAISDQEIESLEFYFAKSGIFSAYP